MVSFSCLSIHYIVNSCIFVDLTLNQLLFENPYHMNRVLTILISLLSTTQLMAQSYTLEDLEAEYVYFTQEELEFYCITLGILAIGLLALRILCQKLPDNKFLYYLNNVLFWASSWVLLNYSMDNQEMFWFMNNSNWGITLLYGFLLGCFLLNQHLSLLSTLRGIARRGGSKTSVNYSVGLFGLPLVLIAGGFLQGVNPDWAWMGKAMLGVVVLIQSVLIFIKVKFGRALFSVITFWFCGGTLFYACMLLLDKVLPVLVVTFLVGFIGYLAMESLKPKKVITDEEGHEVEIEKDASGAFYDDEGNKYVISKEDSGTQDDSSEEHL